MTFITNSPHDKSQSASIYNGDYAGWSRNDLAQADPPGPHTMQFDIRDMVKTYRRTGGYRNFPASFFSLMNGAAVKDFAPTPGLTFGRGKDDFGNPDWKRGFCGWGSAASTPPATPCQFEQDAFTVVDLNASQADRNSEIDEASADMFLNWVYDRVGLGGFQNTSWISINSCSVMGTLQPIERPGDARRLFMTQTVFPALATYFPTATQTIAPTPTP